MLKRNPLFTLLNIHWAVSHNISTNDIDSMYEIRIASFDEFFHDLIFRNVLLKMNFYFFLWNP